MHFFSNSIQLPFFQIVFRQNSRMMVMKRISTPMTQAMAAANREENTMTQGKHRKRDMLRHRPHRFLVMTASKRKKNRLAYPVYCQMLCLVVGFLLSGWRLPLKQIGWKTVWSLWVHVDRWSLWSSLHLRLWTQSQREALFVWLETLLWL